MSMSETAADNQDCANIAVYLRTAAHMHPFKRAVVCSCGRDRGGRSAYAHLTFEQLDRASDRLAHGLGNAGINRGDRTILMVRPSLDFFEIIFGLFKIGAVPVVVDPGMGIKRMLACYQSTRPLAMIGVPLAHAVRTLFSKFFKTVVVRVTVGRRWFWGGHTLKKMQASAWKPFDLAQTHRDEPAAVLFTTGSTGPAKGAVYTHGNFDAQLKQIAGHLTFGADEIDLSTFPLFALFYPALGITAVVPDMDPTRPAQADPQRLIEAICDQGVTNMFASPTLLERLGAYGRTHSIKLPSLKRVISAGAPVQARTIELFQPLLPESADIHTPYGATEAVPIASICGAEILSETRKLTEKGYGICIGRPIKDIPIRIIAIRDDPIPGWKDELLVPQGEIGELVVRGDLVSRGYFENPLADSLAKIPDGSGFWHRMGDLGWMDKKGRIWFCGRKSHRVTTASGTLYTIPCEAIFNTHPLVYRSALVGIGPPGHQAPAICIELKKTKKHINRQTVKDELLDLAAQHDLTRDIKIVLFHAAFPVDIRHNAKIFREKLAVWAASRVKPATLRLRRRTERDS
jgi:acyl-CoA synthetase (AMP-forming)/AMP-acid ligase II